MIEFESRETFMAMRATRFTTRRAGGLNLCWTDIRFPGFLM
ncbi:MAG: hypothetical protein ABRQ30_08255 [Smithellaceae bacterium]